MAETTFFPRRLILGGAVISGVLLALAVHMLGARYGLDLGGLWRSDIRQFMPAGAAIAWWLIATAGFSGGYFTANLMHSAVSGQIPQRMRQFLIVVGVLLWLVNRYIPMDGKIKSILNAVVVICVVIWLLQVFGLIGSLSALHVGK